MNIIQKPSPNFNDRNGAKPNIIVLHYTGMETAEGALDRLTGEEFQVSAHYTVDEDGTLYQHVEEDKRAWHAGKAFWQGDKDINKYSIGIEIVNPGHEFGYRSFTKPQIDIVKELCQEIMERHEIHYVLAHSDVAPERKQDPGELFPWKELGAAGIGYWPNTSDEDFVKSCSMNVYTALHDLGYDAENFPEQSLVAFQRHFVPELFLEGREGEVEGITKARLYVLLARGFAE